jgi:protein-tyrosine phosphatase
MINVLFVCLGNICRSPLAEAVFNDLLQQEGLQDRVSCDSAGTSDYHLGEPPDKRTLDVIRKKNLSVDHLGRQFGPEDFVEFDYIIAMDAKNLDDIRKLESARQEGGYQLFLMREFDDEPADLNVPDPYWGGDRGFLEVHDIVLRSGRNLLDYIKKEHSL